jgi:lipopolysaccharide/colanic/teichoic acid biosynthesis glycosyltransferase
LLGAKLYLKRAIDLVVSAVALVLLAPIMGLIAIAVRLGGGGPILFRQTRIGRGGQPFTILKFRTMVIDAEERREDLLEQSLYPDGRLFKVERDPRVTRVGAFLRRTSLDELPQLWNVLRGDMSLVGPRPPIPSEVELYRAHHYARFDVKPGVTGPWQVSGRNSIRDFDQVIRLETDYIRRWSIGLDISLLARTVPAVLSRRGAH